MSEKKEPAIREGELLKSLEILEQLAKGTTQDLEKSADAVIDDDLLDLEKSAGEDDDTDKDDLDEDEEKSFAAGAAEGSEEIKKAIEVSEFLGELVNQVGGFLDGLKKSIDEKLARQAETIALISGQNATLAGAMNKAIGAIGKDLVKSAEAGEELKKTLEGWGDQPARGRKSKIHVLEKSFEGNSDGESAKLSRNDIMGRMSDMIMKNVEGIRATDLVRFETDGQMHPAVKRLVDNYKG